MATLTTAIARQPALFQARFGSSYWINWINSLLQRLSSEEILPIVDKEAGIIVENKVWIKKPTGCRSIKRISNPRNRDEEYNWNEVEGKIKLINVEFEDYSAGVTALSVFSGYLTTGITVNVTGQTEDAYEDFIFRVISGTYANRAYVLSGNDASGVTTTKLYFLHELTAALDGIKVTDAELVSPDYYIMLEYFASLDAVASVSDEIPFDDQYEIDVVDDYLRWLAELNSSENPDAAAAFEAKFERSFRILKRERRRHIGGPIKGRNMPPFRFKSNGRYKLLGDYTHKD